MLELKVFCKGHINPKAKKCVDCFIDGDNKRCPLVYEPVSCLGHITKNRCLGCFDCRPDNMPEVCQYVCPLQKHDAIAFKYLIAQTPSLIARAQQASAPDPSYHLG